MTGHLALYRKYRSASFAEVIGQEHVTEPLRAALASGRINHAYLFSGPRGCGKTSSARILARSLNCAQGPTPDPCGECDSCRELAPNGPGSIDVIEIDAASHGGVDDARDLRERAFFAPVRDRFKVYIIDEAHMVTPQGFNALLKLVEEPPDFLVFVFATTEPDKVLTTIRSRTHHYPFRLIAPNVLRAHLEAICLAEGITVEPAVLPLVVRAGAGSARDSLSVLDQLLAGAGPTGVTYQRAVALLGVTDAALLDDMVDALAAGDAAAVYATVDRIVQAGHDPRRFAADLLDRFRDLIVLDAVPDAAERGLIDEPEDQLAHMGDQAIRIGGAALTRYAEIVHTALLEMRGTTSARLVLELLCARMQLPDAAVDSAALLQRLERLERRASLVSESAAAADPLPAPPARETGGKTGRAAPAPAPASPPPASGARPAEVRPAPQTSAADSPAGATTDSPAAAPARPRAPWPEPPSAVPPSAVPAPDSGSGESGMPATGVSGGVAPASSVSGQLDAAALRRLWPEILEIVKQASRRTRALLDNAQISDVAGELVTLAAPPALARMIADDSNTSILREALTKVVGGSWRIVTEPENAASSRRAEPAVGDSAAQPTGSRGSGRSFDDDPRDDGDYEPSSTAERTPPADPEAEAIKLLTDQLGAQPLEET